MWIGSYNKDLLHEIINNLSFKVMFFFPENHVIVPKLKHRLLITHFLLAKEKQVQNASRYLKYLLSDVT